MHSWELEGAFVDLVFFCRGESDVPKRGISKSVRRRGTERRPATSVITRVNCRKGQWWQRTPPVWSFSQRPDIQGDAMKGS